MYNHFINSPKAFFSWAHMSCHCIRIHYCNVFTPGWNAMTPRNSIPQLWKMMNLYMVISAAAQVLVKSILQSFGKYGSSTALANLTGFGTCLKDALCHGQPFTFDLQRDILFCCLFLCTMQTTTTSPLCRSWDSFCHCCPSLHTQCLHYAFLGNSWRFLPHQPLLVCGQLPWCWLVWRRITSLRAISRKGMGCIRKE